MLSTQGIIPSQQSVAAPRQDRADSKAGQAFRDSSRSGTALPAENRAEATAATQVTARPFAPFVAQLAAQSNASALDASAPNSPPVFAEPPAAAPVSFGIPDRTIENLEAASQGIIEEAPFPSYGLRFTQLNLLKHNAPPYEEAPAPQTHVSDTPAPLPQQAIDAYRALQSVIGE